MNQLRRSKNKSGFSALEIMITLAIVTILCATVYPAYTNAAMKSRRAEARSALLSTMLQQENYYAQHNTYIAFNSETQQSPFKWWSGQSASTSYYEIQAASCANQPLTQCVLLTAIPGTGKVKNHRDSVCGNLTLDSANNKSYSVSRDTNSTCW
jgi:type IV pilus assembly protein PilE